MKSARVNVTLEAGQAEKLSRLAERMHVPEGTLARSLLSTALDEIEPDAARMTDILEGIEGAFERVELSLEQADQGKAIPLSQL